MLEKKTANNITTAETMVTMIRKEIQLEYTEHKS